MEAMIRVIEQETEIRPIVGPSGNSWRLSLTFEITSQADAVQVLVFLDRRMIPLPSEDRHSLVVSVPGVESSSNNSIAPMSLSHKQVILLILSPIQIGFGTRYILQKHIDFRWWNENLIPNSVDLAIQAQNQLGETFYATSMQGHYTGNANDYRYALLELIRAGRSSHFYFPTQRPVFTMPALAFTKIAPILQKYENTTMFSVTWPSEVDFWTMEAGTNYLVSQVEKIFRTKGLDHPRRMGICPFGMGHTYVYSYMYLREMEIQSKLGIEIRMFMLERMSNILGSDKSGLTAFGDSVGFVFENIHSGILGETASIFFANKDIKYIHEMYREIYENAIPWERYKRERKVLFSPQEDHEIKQRVTYIVCLARKNLGLL